MLIAAWVPFSRRPPAVDIGAFGDRWLEVAFPKKQFALAGLYLRTTKPGLAQFWDKIHIAAEKRRAEHFLFVGDFNTGHTPVDAENGTFSCDRYLRRIRACAYSHRERESGASDHSMLLVDVR